MYENKLKRIIAFAVAVGISLFSIGAGLSHVMISAFEQSTLTKIQEETGTYKKRLIGQIESDFQLLNTTASVIGNSFSNESVHFDTILKMTYPENDFLTMAYFDLNETGIISSEDNLLLSGVALSDLQPEIQEVVQTALQGEKNISSLFYGDFAHEKVFCFGVPVSYNHQIVGALIASSRIDVFSEIIDGEEILDGTTYIHLIDDQGNFLIRSSRAIVKEALPNIFHPPYFARESTEAKSALRRSLPYRFTFTYHDEQYHSLLVPLEFNGWYLFTINSVQNSTRGLYSIVYSVALFFVAVVLLVSFVLVYGYRTIQKSNQQLMDLAYHDRITGAYNISRFWELAQQSIQHHPEYSVVVFNVRKFKFINEIFGKEQADKLLGHMGKILMDHTGKNEYVCRDNADIFYLYLLETRKKVLLGRVKGMIEEIESSPSRVNSNYRITVNCGIAISKDRQDLQTEMTHATFALEVAKTDAKTRIRFFDFDLHEQEKLGNYIESHMHDALAAGEFKLFLQPKIHLSKNTLASAEALVRWQQDGGSMIYPSQFIPIFEQTGFCVDLDLYMVKKVCELLRRWMDRGYPVIPIAINQSKLVLYEDEYVKNLCAILKEYQIPASLITLEILEEIAIEDIDNLNIKLAKLRSAGFQISMDDFGTGYSSLNTLGKLNIDELKLDRNFLLAAKEAKSKKSYLIIEEIVRLANKLSIVSVIEGVETEQDDAFVRKIGSDYAQGYFYSRPMDSDSFTKKYIAC